MLNHHTGQVVGIITRWYLTATRFFWDQTDINTNYHSFAHELAPTTKKEAGKKGQMLKSPFLDGASKAFEMQRCCNQGLCSSVLVLRKIDSSSKREIHTCKTNSEKEVHGFVEGEVLSVDVTALVQI
ncbi:hypothetical protein BS78_07G076200 [Paspalum vaginatum]|nr:hypothetical protein BS78_07G076200 [Paspalum vaginatum]